MAPTIPSLPGNLLSRATHIANPRQHLTHLARSALQTLHTTLSPRNILPQPTLHRRQGTESIPTSYKGLNAGPAPGAVVGITLGAIAGFLLLVLFFWFLSNSRNFIRSRDYDVESVATAPPPPRRTRSRRKTEMSQHSPRTRDRIIRQERITRDFPRSASRGAPAPAAGGRESVLVDERIPERRVDGDDTIEVIEEHSSVAPPRRKSRRGTGGGGGYRSVDPDAYAGGAYPQYPVR
ncbi:hypothetical protein MBLNU230_g5840t1 [Neophaeotheca triangularis]